MPPATLVLVHGGGGSPGDWGRVEPLVNAAGAPTVAVDLSSCQAASTTDDAGVLRDVLSTTDPPVVLVGHSYGGMVITEAGSHPSVKHLVYIDALMPDVDESMMSLMAGQTNEAFAACMDVHADALAWNGAKLTEYFIGRGWSESDAREVLTHLRPMRFGPMVHTATAAAWRTIPSTLIACADSEMGAGLRELFASRATHVVEMPGDHFPHWLRAEEVAELLLRIAREVGEA